jgi:hypothetical protein
MLQHDANIVAGIEINSSGFSQKIGKQCGSEIPPTYQERAYAKDAQTLTSWA